jgi:hypothetical protein
MTKPARIALGIAVAGAVCAALGALASGFPRALAWWTAAACLAVAFAYATNRPGIFGKRNGRLAPLRVLLLLPYVVAFRIACEIVRRLRIAPSWEEVAPGLYVGGRVDPGDLPAGLELIVDLTCEIGEPARVCAHPGYRCLPVLDGAAPPDDEAFLDLLDELRAAKGGVFIHCESGRGRAPTAAALALIARGVASDPPSALELVRKGRPSAAPTRVDLEFIDRIAARL